MYLLIDGKLVSKNEASISPFDHGYMYGLGAFETVRVYNGHPFLWEDHMNRLRQALVELNIKHELDSSAAWMETKRLMRRNKWKNAYIRFNISAGIGEIGLQTEPYTKPTIIIYGKPLPEQGPFNEKELVVLQTRRNTPEGRIRLKSHHYLNSILGKRELKEPVEQEGLFLTEDGFASEGTVSNVFWVKDGRLYTPSLGTGILNGITRQFIMAAAAKLDMDAEEGFYTPQDLLAADEIFLTNSIQEMVPVKRFEGKDFPGAGGKVLHSLLFLYHSCSKDLWSIDELA
ncbi:4-amino-4-deoxychorismate lyase [Fictibacillus enclensis]|uniref:4-amino-4-deoxychorismate lyase n=1 Tax=Fictibacillus enclensis TaxID=1017270 RepID=A0A0V8IP38_9BACL|nr:aminodeoxychorismate lyase [Fictibacillus enclensis]KSU76518.1 4-amino-4-deoxychorismate lyase [Fictibacillus enclensis]SCC42140.1 4-amino-4-deoxychorismate lyase [Fictibacillus enclensis]